MHYLLKIKFAHLRYKGTVNGTRTIFEHVQDIIGTNLLTMFHDYRTIRVLTGFYSSHIRKKPLTAISTEIFF